MRIFCGKLQRIFAIKESLAENVTSLAEKSQVDFLMPRGIASQ